MLLRTKHFLSLLLFLSFYSGLAQIYSIRGRILDADTKEPLAFVSIQINDELKGCVTDIDGKFSYEHDKPIQKIKISYVGYEQQTIPVTKEQMLILLKQKVTELKEVVVLPGENPAHRIILKAIENKDINNPEKVKSFTYHSYNKIVFTAESNKNKQDSSLKTKDDSLTLLMGKFLKKHDLFIMEFASKRKFLYPDYNNEEVIASKVSGFKDPSFALLATQMQPFSFYKDLISISDKNYLNPLASGSINKYFFLLEDTLYQGNDSVFVISFRPRKGKNFDGLKGMLYINTNRYAVQNVIAEPVESKGITMKIQQKYEFIDNQQWFPVQLNTDITFNNIEVNGFTIIGVGRCYIKDIKLNPDLKKSEFSRVELEISKKASYNNDSIWYAYRVDSLTQKDLNTYRFIDSIGKANNFDRKFKSIQSLLTGKIPWGIFDIDINKLFDYNDHEGFRLGLDLHTNAKLSEYFSVGGYAAYGFRDKKEKYGADLKVLINKRNEIEWGSGFYYDLDESGNIEYSLGQSSAFSSAFAQDKLREFLSNRFDLNFKYQTNLTFRTLEYFKINVGVSAQQRTTTYDYAYRQNIDEYFPELSRSTYRFGDLDLGVRFVYKEKFIEAFNTFVSQGSDYPIVTIQASRGVKGLLDGQYDYTRLVAKIEKSFIFKYVGKPYLRITGGFIQGEVPYCRLFNAPASYRDFTIFAPFSFGTMRMNEFASERFVAVFFTHSFGKLLLNSKYFAPEIAVVQNAMWGKLNQNTALSHNGIALMAPDKGFYEAGLLLNNIIHSGISSIGIGALYRYGPYSMAEWKDNVAVKLTTLIAF